MKVRVFIPRIQDSSEGPTFSGTDHNFPVLPSIGHVLRFNDGRAGDFTVVEVGFVQDDTAFLAAVWLEANAQNPTYHSDPPYTVETSDRFRDLNYDVPPESMTGY